MKFLHFFLLLRVIFALLDPDQSTQHQYHICWPQIKPRSFSIASSEEKHGSRLELLVAVVNYRSDICWGLFTLDSSAVGRHRFAADLDPDPDRHQNDADSHANHTQSSHVGK
jgi:hypothetical protein